MPAPVPMRTFRRANPKATTQQAAAKVQDTGKQTAAGEQQQQHPTERRPVAGTQGSAKGAAPAKPLTKPRSPNLSVARKRSAAQASAGERQVQQAWSPLP